MTYIYAMLKHPVRCLAVLKICLVILALTQPTHKCLQTGLTAPDSPQLLQRNVETPAALSQRHTDSTPASRPGSVVLQPDRRGEACGTLRLLLWLLIFMMLHAGRRGLGDCHGAVQRQEQQAEGRSCAGMLDAGRGLARAASAPRCCIPSRCCNYGAAQLFLRQLNRLDLHTACKQRAGP